MFVFSGLGRVWCLLYLRAVLLCCSFESFWLETKGFRDWGFEYSGFLGVGLRD